MASVAMELGAVLVAMEGKLVVAREEVTTAAAV